FSLITRFSHPGSASKAQDAASSQVANTQEEHHSAKESHRYLRLWKETGQGRSNHSRLPTTTPTPNTTPILTTTTTSQQPPPTYTKKNKGVLIPFVSFIVFR
ncbi:hypothetical protein D6783_02510, partial [Candidatus Woesearchaeota archaeon]